MQVGGGALLVAALAAGCSTVTLSLNKSLGAPVAAEARRVLEVKTRGPAPAWLAELGLTPIEFSKFEAASTAIHG